MVNPKEDKTRYELHTHLGKMGIEGTVVDPSVLDIDYDYPYLDLDAPTSGITSLGSIRLHGYPINIVNIVREKNYEVGKLGFGGDYGPIEFASNGWRLRFFITSYDEVETQITSDSEHFYLMTSAKLERGFLSTKMVDFSWQAPNSVNGTTRSEDEILTKLNNDSALHTLLLNELSKERAVTIKSYKPKKTPEQTGAEASYAQIVIYGEVRKKKDIFINRSCFDMYNKIAEHVLQVKTIL